MDPVEQVQSAEAMLDFVKGHDGGRIKVGDVLCNLMLYCQAKSINFDDELDYACRHFEAEKVR